MRGFDSSQGITAVIIGGGILLIILEICLLAAGFSERDISRVWGALALVWVPGFFIWGGLERSDDDFSN